MRRHKGTVLGVLTALVTAACSTPSGDVPPLVLASHVDLPRFMGDWYVIASIPTMFEKDVQNARDTYRLRPDGSIATTFTFNAGSPTGPVRHYESVGVVLDPASNAVWGQQYVWPFKADYRISYVSPEYDLAVIAREKRDHVWIMARTPSIPEAALDRLTTFVASLGYDPARLERVPQQPPK